MVSNAELPHSQNNNQIWECLPTTSNYVDKIAFSPDGKTLATGHGENNGGITVWDVNSGKKVQTFAVHAVSASRVCSNGFGDRDQVAVSPDGKAIAISGYNDMIKLWDTQTGSFLRSLESKFHPLFTNQPKC